VLLLSYIQDLDEERGRDCFCSTEGINRQKAILPAMISGNRTAVGQYSGKRKHRRGNSADGWKNLSG